MVGFEVDSARDGIESSEHEVKAARAHKTPAATVNLRIE